MYYYPKVQLKNPKIQVDSPVNRQTVFYDHFGFSQITGTIDLSTMAVEAHCTTIDEIITIDNKKILDHIKRDIIENYLPN